MMWKMQMQERFERVVKSRWNRWYRDIRTVGVPRYLRNNGKEKRLTMIARFRLENEMREGRYSYWERKEKRKCRIYGCAEESWKHVVEICMGEGRGGGREEILRILGDDGRGKSWMRQLLERRREKEGEGGGRNGDGRTVDREDE